MNHCATQLREISSDIVSICSIMMILDCELKNTLKELIKTTKISYYNPVLLNHYVSTILCCA